MLFSFVSSSFENMHIETVIYILEIFTNLRTTVFNLEEKNKWWPFDFLLYSNKLFRLFSKYDFTLKQRILFIYKKSIQAMKIPETEFYSWKVEEFLANRQFSNEHYVVIEIVGVVTFWFVWLWKWMNAMPTRKSSQQRQRRGFVVTTNKYTFCGR